MKKRILHLLPLSAAAIALSLTGCVASASTAHPSRSAGDRTTHLPASFPAHDVPILKGRLLVASGDAADGWTVTVEPTDGDLASAETALTKAGFAATRTTATSATFADHDYTVSVQTPGRSVTYLVTRQ